MINVKQTINKLYSIFRTHIFSNGLDKETVEEIRESLKAYRRGEIESYQEVFGHPQPGFEGKKQETRNI